MFAVTMHAARATQMPHQQPHPHSHPKAHSPLTAITTNNQIMFFIKLYMKPKD